MVGSRARPRSAIVTLLVDARAPERFDGTNEPLDRTPGHIPGAVNYFYKRNVTDDGVMLPPERLRQQLAEVLADRPPDQVVMYCGSGVTACHNLLWRWSTPDSRREAIRDRGRNGPRTRRGPWKQGQIEEWKARSKFKLKLTSHFHFQL